MRRWATVWVPALVLFLVLAEPHPPLDLLPHAVLGAEASVLPEPGWRAAASMGTDTARPLVPFRAFNPQNVQWEDVDLDGRPEILTTNANGWLYLFDPSGALVAEAPGPGRREGDAVQPGVPVADLDHDGRRELYVKSNDGWLRQLEVAGREGGRIVLEERWTRCLGCGAESDGTPWAARGLLLDPHDDHAVHRALRPDGSVAWVQRGLGGNAGAAAGDLDGDGRPEFVFATDGGLVGARAVRDGTLRWTADAGALVGEPRAAVPFQPTVADLDGDGRAEVAVGLRSARPPPGAAPAAAYVLLGGDGQPRWWARPAGGSSLVHGHAATVDVNLDGVLDLLWQDWNTEGHRPGAFARTGPSHVLALDGRTGAQLWMTPLDAAWSDGDLCVADVDGDGAQEVLAAHRHGGRDGLAVLDLEGRLEAFWPAPGGWSVARGALAVPWEERLHLVVSLARPSQAEGVQSPAMTSPDGRLLLLDTGQPYRAAWPGRFDFAS